MSVTTKTIAAVKAPKAAPKSRAKPIAHAVGVKFAIAQGARPTAGTRLFSYTMAWLTLSGMADGAELARKTVTRIAGSTAVGYHIKQGNFTDNGTALTVSARGLAFFAQRVTDAPLTEAYISFMESGKTSDVCRNADNVISL